jgi:hypothetical protein
MYSAVDDYKRQQQEKAEKDHYDQMERDYNEYLELEHRDWETKHILSESPVLTRFLITV